MLALGAQDSRLPSASTGTWPKVSDVTYRFKALKLQQTASMRLSGT